MSIGPSLRRLVIVFSLTVVIAASSLLIYMATQPRNPVVRDVRVVGIEAGGDTLTVALSAEVENPSSSGVTVVGGVVNVFYGRGLLGQSRVVGEVFVPGGASAPVPLNLEVRNMTLFGEILAEIASQRPVELRYEGSVDTRAGPIPLSVAVSGTTLLRRMWLSFSVESVYAEGGVAVARIVAYNPFNVDIRLAGVRGYIYYGGERAAELRVAGPVDIPGNSSSTIRAEVSLLSLSRVANDIVSKGAVDLVFRGEASVGIGNFTFRVPLTIGKAIGVRLTVDIHVGKIVLGPTLLVEGRVTVVDGNGVIELPVRCLRLRAYVESGDVEVGEIVVENLTVFPLRNANLTFGLRPTRRGLGLLIGQIFSGRDEMRLRVTRLEGVVEILGVKVFLDADASINATAHLRSATYMLWGDVGSVS